MQFSFAWQFFFNLVVENMLYKKQTNYITKARMVRSMLHIRNKYTNISDIERNFVL